MQLTNPYIVDGNAKMRLSYCIYMDILGFNEKTRAAFKTNKGEELFNKIHNAMLKGSELLADDTTAMFNVNPFWCHKIFTDNVVLGYPIPSGSDGEPEFGDIIAEVAEYQLAMSLEGLFVRGGFTIGQLYISDEMVFGMALLDAFEIESKIANNPRIVISQDVMKLVDKHLKYYGKSSGAPQNKVILIDSDNQPFVNYLYDTIDYNGCVNTVMLKKHKQNVEQCLIEFKNEPYIWSKYLWVANYHNYFCRSVRGDEAFRKEYLIDSRLAVQEPRRLIEEKNE